jgi:abortive infection bacteriophage resistance protein
MCAHNSRLWNRRLIQQVMLQPNDLPRRLMPLAGGPHDKVYPVLAITAHLTDQLNPDAHWSERMKAVLAGFPRIPGRTMGEMGLPTGWTGKAIWKQGA